MFKARMKFAKEGRAKYISHLDLMHAMQRAMARCQMPLWFTEGFHQHAYVSVALPLPTGFSGECEFLDFQVVSEALPEHAVDRLNAVLPKGLRALEVYPMTDGGRKVSEIAWSQYRVTWGFEDEIPEGFSGAVQELFEKPEILLMKRSKRGEKLVNIREFMRDVSLARQDGAIQILVTTAAGNHSMNPAYLAKAVEQYLPAYSIPFCAYHRLQVFTADGTPFR